MLLAQIGVPFDAQLCSHGEEAAHEADQPDLSAGLAALVSRLAALIAIKMRTQGSAQRALSGRAGRTGSVGFSGSCVQPIHCPGCTQEPLKPTAQELLRSRFWLCCVQPRVRAQMVLRTPTPNAAEAAETPQRTPQAPHDMPTA